MPPGSDSGVVLSVSAPFLFAEAERGRETRRVPPLGLVVNSVSALSGMPRCARAVGPSQSAGTEFLEPPKPEPVDNQLNSRWFPDSTVRLRNHNGRRPTAVRLDSAVGRRPHHRDTHRIPSLLEGNGVTRQPSQPRRRPRRRMGGGEIPEYDTSNVRAPPRAVFEHGYRSVTQNRKRR